MARLLLFSVFVIATCGLVYELIAGALASYLLGDSVTQFSTVIGVYLFSMGVGSYVSKYITRRLLSVFIEVEILVGLVGGFSATLLFLLFEHVESFRALLYGLVGLTGVLVGLEIPLLMRILQDRYEFKELVSRVFAVDYVGALLASLLFPLVLAPYLGLMRSGLFFGMLNIAVAAATLYLFRREVRGARGLAAASVLAFIALVITFIFSGRLLTFAEKAAYDGEPLYALTTPYQRIVLTRNANDYRLFLNGNLQFSSVDEYRYHEALVHPVMRAVREPKDVLILGGGDGLAAREVLKYPSVRSITLVDLDPAMTRLFASHPTLRRFNGGALSSPKIKVYNEDAFLWIKANKKTFDCAIIDFPDPSNFSLGKLYTERFYRYLKKALKPEGFAVVQSTSPYVARKAFWCIAKTLRAAGFETTPYHAYVPSFGEWGFILAGTKTYQTNDVLPKGLRFMNDSVFTTLTRFPPDMDSLPVEVNRLNNQTLVHYFEQEWKVYAH